MLTATKHSVPLTLARGGLRPATCGQKSMWEILADLRPEIELLNLQQMLLISGELTIEAVLEAIGEVVSRHESLRTRYRQGEDGELLQYLPEQDGLSAEVYHIDGEQTAELAQQVQDELAATRFDLATDWPFRVVVAVVDGLPRAVAFTVSHIAVDLAGLQVLHAELSQHIEARAGSAAVPPSFAAPCGQQPFEVAAYEHSAEGGRVLDKALGYWREVLEGMPRTPFSEEPRPPAKEGRYWRGEFRSRAVTLACELLAVRHRVTSSAVILAAVAVVLGRRTGNPRFGIGLMASNRLTPELQQAVGNITQIIYAPVSLTGPSFEQVLRSALSGALRAYRHGRFDVRRRDGLMAEIGHQRGMKLELTTYFNDVRGPAKRRGAEVTVQDVLDARAESTFSWVERLPRENLQMLLAVRDGDDGSDGVCLSGLFDTCFLPPQEGRAVLEGIETVLVTAATSSTDLEALVEATGFSPPPREHGWLLVDGCWTHLPSVEKLVRDAVRPLALDVVVEGAPDGSPQLVAHLVPGSSGVSPEAVHRACTDLMAGRPTAMAPHRYVLYAHDPEEPGSTVWRESAVLASGPGRRRTGQAQATPPTDGPLPPGRDTW
ncbi:condensation domain-containing protein [Streptomyces sp. NPDC048106]|uniref:condensation domain-containing protein n=1 Tax=Streptomyces sp. NPDC048106 TaxID=3155750 RepID=UPI0034519BD5